MGWPKGMPRKGHVNKDGSTHRKWGEKIKSIPEPSVKTGRKIRMRRVSADLFDAPNPNHPKVPATKFTGIRVGDPDRPDTHGDRPGRPVIEPCPNCGFAYADGGYCESCGWSKPVIMGRVS